MKRKLFKGGKMYLFKNVQQSPLQIKSLREMTQYSDKQKVLTESPGQWHDEDLDKEIKVLLEQQIDSMLKKIKQIIDNHQANSKHVMNYVRSSILFKQNDEINPKTVSEILGVYTKNKIEDLKNFLQEKDKEIVRLKSEMQQEKQFNQSNIQFHSVNLNSFRQNSISLQAQHNTLESSLLFQKAKNSTKKQFDQYIKKMKLKFMPSISSLRDNSFKQNIKPRKINFINKNNKKQYCSLLIQFIKKINLINDEDKTNLIQFVNNNLTGLCSQPCCKWSESNSVANKTPTPLQIHSNRSKSYYKSDKIDAYYDHYYHSEVFQIDKIQSLTKTNSEQMQRLYNKYKSKQRYANKRHSQRKQSIL